MANIKFRRVAVRAAPLWGAVTFALAALPVNGWPCLPPASVASPEEHGSSDPAPAAGQGQPAPEAKSAPAAPDADSNNRELVRKRMAICRQRPEVCAQQGQDNEKQQRDPRADRPEGNPRDQ